MSKVFLLVFLFFLAFNQVFSYEKPKIISRSEWGADESLTYTNSPEWQAIFKKWSENAKKPKKEPTSYQKFLAKKAKEANIIISTRFADFIKTSGRLTEENGNRLAWPISYSAKVRAITIHHTEQEYKDDVSGLKSILRFHSISREWGDIGYNFIIGYDGDIYEGRKGGETAIGAHTKYNNQQTIGISILGNYDEKDISEKQKKSLETLVKYLVEKYKIDMTKKQPFFKKCFTKECEEALIINYEYPIVGHRDAGVTDCPGDILYAHMKNLRTRILMEQLNYKNLKKKYFPVFEKIPKEKLKIAEIRIKNYLKENQNKKIEQIGKLIQEFLQLNHS